jgi:hypothetical protein
MTNSIQTVDSHKSFEIDNQNKEPEWTVESLVDELFLNLADTKAIVTNDKGRTITIRKYYSQARQLIRWIPVARLPSNEFVINICDLTPQVIRKIESVIDSPRTLQYILTQALGRIFENLEFQYYHISIAKNLRVKMMP